MNAAAPARAWLAAIGALAQLAFGCDQVGEPLVGGQPPGVLIPRVTCGPPASCEPREVIEHARVTVHAVDLALCRRGAPDDSMLCEPPPDAGSGSGGELAGVDAGVPDDVAPGDVDDDPDAPVLPPCQPEPARVPVPAALRCQDFAGREAPESSASGERLARAEWHDANVRIESSVPRTVVIERLTLSNVWIELRGPVTLRIDASGRVPGTPFDAIEGLRVAGVATAAGAPRLELEGVKIKTLAIGDDAHPFEGAVSTRSCELLELGVIARQVQLESTRVDQGRLHAEQLITADSVLLALEIESDRAVLSASVVRKVELKRCGELSLIATSVEDSVVAACSGSPARFYKAQLTGSTVDGVIESENTRYGATAFGTNGPTELIVFDGGFDRASFCTGLERLVVSGAVSVKCAMCEQVETFVADAVCRAGNGEIKGKDNLCVGLNPEDKPRPPVCELPWPEFHRVDDRF